MGIMVEGKPYLEEHKVCFVDPNIFVYFDKNEFKVGSHVNILC